MSNHSIDHQLQQEISLVEQLFTKKVEITGDRGVRVVLAEDNPGVRSGIRRLLTSTGEIKVVGEAENGEQALRRVEELDPDVLVLDLEMPVLSGHQVAAQLKQAGRRVKVLVLSAHADRQYILSVFGEGIAGYIVKEDVPGTLVDAVLGIAAGDSSWISPSVAERLVVGGSTAERRTDLSEVEHKTLLMVQAGLDDEEIGRRLQMDTPLVTRTVLMVLAKLGIRSRWDLCLG